MQNAYQKGDIVYVLEMDDSWGYGIGRVVGISTAPQCYYVQLIATTHPGDRPGDIYDNLGEDRMQPYFLADGEPGSQASYDNPYSVAHPPRIKSPALWPGWLDLLLTPSLLGILTQDEPSLSRFSSRYRFAIDRLSYCRFR